MDWSPPARRRSILYIVLGFALLATPLVVSHYDLADPDRYRYEAGEVTFYDNGTFDMPSHAKSLDSDVACLQSYPPSRSCMLERAIHANGGVSYEDGLSEQWLSGEYDYVFAYGDGFYEPVAEEMPNETVRYDLEPVSRDQALDTIATPIDRASPDVRTAARTGQVETRDELDGANELVRTEDGLYVVYLAAAHVTNNEQSPGMFILQMLLVVLGAWLVLRGQRHHVRQSR